MTLIVEDGTGKVDAQSYIDVAFADAYFTARGVAAWTGSNTVKEQAILRAMDYLENRWRWLGYAEFPDTPQALRWPRVYVYEEGRAVTGIPLRLKQATAEYALRALTGELQPDPTAQANGMQVVGSREKVGPIETEVSYLAGSQSSIRSYPAADQLVRLWAASGQRAVRA